MDRGARDGQGAMPVSSGVNDGASQWPCKKGPHITPRAERADGRRKHPRGRVSPHRAPCPRSCTTRHHTGGALREGFGHGQGRMVPGDLWQFLLACVFFCPPLSGGLDLDSRSSGCARLGGLCFLFLLRISKSSSSRKAKFGRPN